MTEQEINVAIAEACGWEWYRIPQKPIHGPRIYKCPFLPSVHEIGQAPGWLVKSDGTESVCNWHFMHKEGGVLNYCRDLNAMHEAEKVFNRSAGERSTYERALRKLCASDNSESTYGRETWKATAMQRAEAFLRTVGKWKD